MLMFGRKKNKLVNEWMKGKMCEVTTVFTDGKTKFILEK